MNELVVTIVNALLPHIGEIVTAVCVLMLIELRLLINKMRKGVHLDAEIAKDKREEISDKIGEVKGILADQPQSDQTMQKM